MATRFKLTNDTTAPDVSPALQSYTHDAPATVRRKLLLTDSSTLTTTAYTPDASDDGAIGDSLWCQFVSDPMAAGKTFLSDDTIKMAMQALEPQANNNLFLQLYISIVSEDGGTVRRVLRSKVNDDIEINSPTTIQNRFFSTVQSGADYTTVSGDRLVVEISVQGDPGGGGGVQGHNGSMRFGGSGSSGDLPEDNGETGTTYNPWIEFVPSELFDANVVVTPSAASLALTGFAPTVLTPRVVKPGAASLTLTGQVPSIIIGTVVRPGSATATLTGFAPTISISEHILVTPGAASLSLTGFAPTVLTPRLVTPGAASLTLTGFAPSVIVNTILIPASASLVLTGFAPTIVVDSGGLVLIPPAASLTLTGFAPTVLTPRLVVPEAADLTLTGFAPTVLTPRTVTPSPATLTLTGFAPTVLLPKLVIPGPASLVLTGFEPIVFITSPDRDFGESEIITLSGRHSVIQTIRDAVATTSSGKKATLG